MNKNKLIKARKQIDHIDGKLFNLIKKRTKIVRYMLTLKKNKNQIVDQKRIKIILKEIRNKSLKNNIDPKITSRIWKNMIWGYIEFQKKNFIKK